MTLPTAFRDRLHDELRMLVAERTDHPTVSARPPRRRPARVVGVGLAFGLPAAAAVAVLALPPLIGGPAVTAPKPSTSGTPGSAGSAAPVPVAYRVLTEGDEVIFTLYHIGGAAGLTAELRRHGVKAVVLPGDPNCQEPDPVSAVDPRRINEVMPFARDGDPPGTMRLRPSKMPSGAVLLITFSNGPGGSPAIGMAIVTKAPSCWFDPVPGGDLPSNGDEMNPPQGGFSSPGVRPTGE